MAGVRLEIQALSRPLPSSCYRLQLRGGMDFRAAEQLLPTLVQLGISHLYLSPIIAAQQYSLHGYDVTDPTCIDGVLGGRAGFDWLADDARDNGLAIILDIVPNHMSFSLENIWLRDVLRNGDDSRHRSYLDIRDGCRLALPMLPAPFAECLQNGLFQAIHEPEGPVLVQGALRVPLDPRTLPASLWNPLATTPSAGCTTNNSGDCAIGEPSVMPSPTGDFSISPA